MKRLLLLVSLMFIIGCSPISTPPAKAYVVYIGSLPGGSYSGQVFYINGLQYLHPYSSPRYRIDGSAIKVSSDLPFGYSVDLNGVNIEWGTVGVKTGSGYESYVLEVK